MNKEFGLIWENKPDENTLKLKTHNVKLAMDSSKRIEQAAGEVEHTLINSDNIFALEALQSIHKGKIDMIYIDPPYNTGNKDFIYNDHYLDSQDQYKHSKWLSFISERLELAKNLLTEDGVIFVSIDDNEQANLRLLMNKIFKPQNFIAQMVWKSGGGVGQDSKFLSNALEYILVFAKNKTKTNFGKKPILLKEYKLHDKHINERGGYKVNGLDRGSLNYSPSLDYVITDPSTNIEYRAGKATETERLERTLNKTKRKDWCWRWSESKVQWGIENDFIFFKNGKVYFKQYALVNNKNEQVVKGNPYSNFIDHISTASGTRLVKDIIGSGFSYPKPVELIKYLIEIANLKDDAIILDFFAGSGTTGHAVISYNNLKNKKYQSILITDGGKIDTNTPNIAEEITYERIKRVLTGQNWSNGKLNPKLQGNLSYFTIELIEKKYKETEEN